MIKRVITCFLAILFVVTITPDNLNAMENDLPDCVVITHCVREDFKVRDLENAFQKATKIVSETPRTNPEVRRGLYGCATKNYKPI